MTNQLNQGKLISREVHWFTKILRRDFGIKITHEDVSVEGLELGMDEVDSTFIPQELFEVVPSTLLYELMVVDDIEGNVWSATIAFYPNSPQWCLKVITRNDFVKFRKLLSIIDE